MPTADFNKTFLAKLLDRINKKGKRLILLGDFNINLLLYRENNNIKRFSPIIPTISQSSTLIDNILMSHFGSKIYTHWESISRAV